jgi:hypothetical protein
MRILLALLALTACAGRRAEGPQDTEVQIVDEQGEPLLGTSSFWSRDTNDKCVQYGASCAVALPTGDYSLTFRKERAGRPGSSLGGTVQSEKSAGCLRARVHVVPGQKIVCKKTQPFNCEKGVYDNMDCGAAAAVRYGYKPQPGDQAPDAR